MKRERFLRTSIHFVLGGLRQIFLCQSISAQTGTCREEVDMSRTTGEWSRLFGVQARMILIVLLFAVSTVAQRRAGTPANDPSDPINQEKANKTDMRNREFMMGNSGKPIRRAVWGPATAAMPQIKDDFERIQIVNKELMTAVFANNLVNPRQIAKATTDIEKRASRMISNLAYPQPHEPEKTLRGVQDGDDIRLALSKLDSAIMSFVTNPIFQTDRQVVNTELAMKVTKELKTVVKLSESIRRQAEALSKAQRAL